MILFPNAKINLGLDILRKREDGYHDIETVMIPVPWRDVLEIVPAKGADTTLTVTGRDVDCPPEKNLVMKAYRTLAEEAGLPPVDIYLRKIIPDGAGLGGGSADAAFTLSGLNDMFSLGYTAEELAHVASSLGADCPFFIYNRPMLCRGTGIEMAAVDVDLSGLEILIVKPQVSVPTAAAYSHTAPSIPSERIGTIIKGAVESWQGKLKNDFEPSVFPVYPEVEAVKHRIMELGPVYASMSGSGAAAYGLFRGDILSLSAENMFAGCAIFRARL